MIYMMTTHIVPAWVIEQIEKKMPGMAVAWGRLL
jgi:hypothetical protein